MGGTIRNPGLITENCEEYSARTEFEFELTFSDTAIEDYWFQDQQKPLKKQHSFEHCVHLNNLLWAKVASDYKFILGIYLHRHRHNRSRNQICCICKCLKRYHDHFFRSERLNPENPSFGDIHMYVGYWERG